MWQHGIGHRMPPPTPKFPSATPAPLLYCPASPLSSSSSPPPPQDQFEEESVLPLDVMPLNAVGQTFTVLRRPEGSVSLGKLANILRFKLKEIDPATGEMEVWQPKGGAL